MAEIVAYPTPRKKKLFSWLLPILALSIVYGWYFVHEKLDDISVYQDSSGKISMVVPDAWPDRWIDSHDPRTVAESVNLPTTLIVLPFELLIHGTAPAESPSFVTERILGFSVAGAFLWIFVGRFVDDGRIYLRTHLYPLLSRKDYAFTICLIFLTTVALIACRTPWDLGWAAIWESIGVSALLFRLRQRKQNTTS